MSETATPMLLNKKTTHQALVVPFEMTKIEDADALSLVRVGGYTCVVRTEDWAGVDKAVYVVPDSVVDTTRPEFGFLAPQADSDGLARIRARKFLKKYVSYGLLVPAPADAVVGEDWAERLGVKRYDADDPTAGGHKKRGFTIGGEHEPGPDLLTGPDYYDVDALRSNMTLIDAGTPVFVQEKLDGSNYRVVFHDGRYWVKSRNCWVRRNPNYDHVTREYLEANMKLQDGTPNVDGVNRVLAEIEKKKGRVAGIWEFFEKQTELWTFLAANPGTTVYGEVYGNTHQVKYGFPDGNKFAAFDVYTDGRFLNGSEAYNLLTRAGVPTAPLIAEDVPFDFAQLEAMSDRKSAAPGCAAGTVCEGLVIRPTIETHNPRYGRVILKLISPEYMTMKVAKRR